MFSSCWLELALVLGPEAGLRILGNVWSVWFTSSWFDIHVDIRYLTAVWQIVLQDGKTNMLNHYSKWLPLLGMIF